MNATNESCARDEVPDLGFYFLESGFIWEIVIIIFSVYVIVAFGLHGKKCHMLTSKSRKDMHRGLVYKFALVTVFIPFLRYAGTLSFIISGRLCNEYFCEFSADFSYIALMLSITTTYSFLWLRQRVFYSHPSLCDRYGRCLVYFSKFVIIPIVAEGVIAVAIAVAPVEYTAMNYECHPIVHQSDPKAIAYAGLMVLTQAVLLGLFLHPVVSHMKVQRRITMNSKASETVHTSQDSSYVETSGSTHTNNNERSSKDVRSGMSGTNSVENRDGIDSNGYSSDDHETESVAETHSPSDEISEINPYINKQRSRSAPDLLRTAVKNCQKTSVSRSTTVINARGEWVKPEKVRSRSVMSTLKIKRDVLKKKVRNTRSTVRSRGKVMKLIKRTVYLCIICMITDFLVSVINTVGWDDIHQAMQFVIYDLSMMINMMTVVASFENFRKILLLPLSCLSHETPRNLRKSVDHHSTVSS